MWNHEMEAVVISWEWDHAYIAPSGITQRRREGEYST